MHWQTSRHLIDLSRPRVMGIVNVTPDSFSDGGRYAEHALGAGALRAAAGRRRRHPGHRRRVEPARARPPVPLEEELARVLPVLREAVTLGVPVSVDTYKPEVMRQALDLGADIINDIWALRQPGAREAVAAHPRCGICLMHMHGEPRTMQRSPMEGDAVPQVLRLPASRRRWRCGSWAWTAARIAWDPGIGFGKTVEQNFALLARQHELLAARLSAAGRLVAQVVAGHRDRACPSTSGWPQASRRRCWRWSAARISCACTT